MPSLETASSLAASIGRANDPLGLTPLPEDNRQRFLRFMLAKKKDALLPLHQIVEVMQIALEDIFPVPDMPGCILGVCSWQGETLWLVDLNHFVGYEPLHHQSEVIYTPFVIVVQEAGRSLGLVVEQVDDVDLFDEDHIHKESGLCPPSLEPFVRGYCPQQGGTVLDVSAMVDASLWRSHGSAGGSNSDARNVSASGVVGSSAGDSVGGFVDESASGSASYRSSG